MSLSQSTISDKIKCAEIYRHNDGSGLLLFVCFHCGESFDSFDDISHHIDVEHFWNEQIKIKRDPVEENLVSSIEFIALKEELTDDLQLLPQADQSNFNLMPTNILIKETYFEAKPVENPAQNYKASTRKHQCIPCNRAFRDSTLLFNHMARHANLQQFQCYICKNRFNTRTALARHMVRLHNDLVVAVDGQPFPCPKCDATYRLKESLTNHLYTKHSEKKYICEYCDKPFAVPSVMRKHMKVHTNEKPVQCHMCGKRFPDNGSHTTHLKLFHNIENKSLTCAICNRDFASLFGLNRHTREQHGSKKYNCKVCGNAFKSHRVLLQHMDLHGEKRHKCNYCDMTFAQSSGRRGHEKVKHLNLK